jgi:hypothetical protein
MDLHKQNIMKTLKSKLIIAIALISVGVIFLACKDDTTSLLTDKTWVLESVNMAGMDMTQAEILASEGSEYQMTLKADGTVVFADNMGMNPMTGKWKLQQNDNQFVVSGIDGANSDVNTINKLTSTDLWFWHMDGNDKMIMHYKVK